MAGSRPDAAVLILSSKDDEHVPLVTGHLTALGVPFAVFDPGTFPDTAELQVRFGADGHVSGDLSTDGCQLTLQSISSAWHRRPHQPLSRAVLEDPSVTSFIELASRHFLEGVWETLDCRWLPASPAQDRFAHNKLVQLGLARRMGFRVPDTVIGNSIRHTAQFYSSHSGAVVSKSLIQRPLTVRGFDIPALYTQPVDRRDLRRLRSIQYSPVIFQRRVEKQSELRVTVVGHSVFTAEIRSQEHRATRHDWRHYHDDRVAYRPYELSRVLEEACVAYVKALGLNFGAIDLVLEPNGQVSFLEINPNGQWGFIEEFTGLPIAAAIAEFLAEGVNA